MPPRGKTIQVQKWPETDFLLENYICLHDNRHLRECISERLYNKLQGKTGHFKYKEKEMKKKKEKLKVLKHVVYSFVYHVSYAHGAHTTWTKSKR